MTTVLYPVLTLSALATGLWFTGALTVTVLDAKECAKLGMGMFLAVGQGSDQEPKFVHMTYKPAKKPKKLAPIEDGPPVDDNELQALKDWRRERADGKPAYTVATDATLREVIRRRPRTPDDLLAIKGIGPSFVDKHAESLLELLAQ